MEEPRKTGQNMEYVLDHKGKEYIKSHLDTLDKNYFRKSWSTFPEYLKEVTIC